MVLHLVLSFGVLGFVTVTDEVQYSSYLVDVRLLWKEEFSERRQEHDIASNLQLHGSRARRRPRWRRAQVHSHQSTRLPLVLLLHAAPSPVLPSPPPSPAAELGIRHDHISLIHPGGKGRHSSAAARRHSTGARGSRGSGRRVSAAWRARWEKYSVRRRLVKQNVGEQRARTQQ